MDVLSSPPRTRKPERIEAVITYLEQTKRPSSPKPAQPKGRHAILRCEEPPVSFYRYIYSAVGTPHKWVSRRYLNDDDLSALICKPSVNIFVLYREGWVAGFAELEHIDTSLIEIRFFGLVPEAKNKGLGGWFLYEILQMAWQHDPQKIRIETCSLDDPAALRLYQKMGFSVYGQATGVIEWYG
ncbi:acetyltransferase, GNAT family protein [Parvularcula bermudensis HTCC2503]|uniref:Acetyltransferase, GNAT family protein n=1 Tax=Parvularcula bermudensis (strain ATCC BAA-594 / HTCC2503 / KCTC 12087) TaxID=314260 RepID=E0TDW6_PARBH|nr:GNAT family N-acetyltransferase [Parvularcula bermudensis]ADM10415.1 acetyltransferase, GNAT family protein [Parvularcula bermudensis HTCC2503]